MAEFSERDKDNISKTHDMITRLTPIIERHEKSIDEHSVELRQISGKQLVQAEQIETLEEDSEENKDQIGKAFKGISVVKALIADVTVKRMVALVGGGAAIIVALIRFLI